MSLSVEPQLNALLFKHPVCHITVSMRCYFIKKEITYSHGTQKFGIQIHYYSKMYNCIGIKITWYAWIEGYFLSSDLYKAKQVTAFNSSSLHPSCYSLVCFTRTRKIK